MISDPEQLVERIRIVLGEPGGWKSPDGYRDGLALCVIDSIYSIGVKYASVENVIGRYREHRRQQEGDPKTDGCPELLATFTELGGSEAWAHKIGNQNRTSSRMTSPLKALVVEQAARMLSGQDINTTNDLREFAAADASIGPVRDLWRKLPGQRSGISWRYLHMLAGVDNVKPDRMIRGFLAQQLPDGGGQLSADQAADLVRRAAGQLGVKAAVLDHRIWLFQSGRLT